MGNTLNINTVAVIGANGTMGRNVAAIFAAFGNAKVYMISRTMEKSVGAINQAYLSVRAESIKANMIAADYSDLEKCVQEADLVFETCAEDWAVKSDIHQRIASAVHGDDKKIICTGTSGLSVTKLAELYPESLRHLFMGMHFFNPPYQMTLCEMIPTKYTEADDQVFEAVKQYAQDVLYRTVVQTADTPAFLGNRIGFQFINEAIQMAEQYKDNGGIDYIDAILGSFTGRSMAPIVTANFVGLDVHKAIVDNLFENTNDYAHATFEMPAFLNKLVAEGKTGRKAGAGLYKTVVHDNGVKSHQVFDIAHMDYRDQMAYTFPFVEEIVDALRVGEYEKAFTTLVTNQSIEAKICCEFMLKYIVYSINTAKEMHCPLKAADDVMAAGFHWCPPLAMYEAFSSVTDVKALCKERLSADINKVIEEKGLLNDVETSAYDYRKYILAKH